LRMSYFSLNLPGLDLYGKVIAEGPNKIFMAPNGNGGLYSSLLRYEIIKHMKDNGVSHLHVFGVDNVLCKVVDPYFLGFAESKDYDITCKYVPKAHSKEAVGVHILRNGKPHMIEYSEITQEMANQKDAEGNLVYDCSHILNMLVKVSYLEDIVSIKKKELAQKFHVAKKKIKYFDHKLKQIITPLENNGYKFELFITDAFLLCDADKFGVLEVKREEEFAPVKNAPGASEDSPDTARNLMSKLYQRWLKTKGIQFSKEASGKVEESCEINPAIAYDFDDLSVESQSNIMSNKIFDLPFYLG